MDKLPTQGIPLFPEKHIRQALRHGHVIPFREMVLPPIRDIRSSEAINDRLMERAGVGPKSARSMQWFENERDTYQHHAEYLKRLSKLREELINQEQTNLANALERLRMRSYGREYIYSRPKERKINGNNKPYFASDSPRQRKSLMTTLEKFQKMRPKKSPPKIQPVEGKSLLEKQSYETPYANHEDKDSDVEKSVDESVRMNLQRLTGQRTASIPRGNRNGHNSIVLESSSIRKASQDNRSSSVLEEKMTRRHQRTFRMRHEVDKLKLSPQSVKIDINDEDGMDVGNLRDYYCVYYIPAPAPSPSKELEGPTLLPQISPHCHHGEGSGKGAGNLLEVKNVQRHLAPRAASELLQYPACTCNCSCRMFVSGSKMEVPCGNMVDQNGNLLSNNNKLETGSRKSDTGSSQYGSRKSDRSSGFTETPRMTSNGTEKRQIVVDMPAIVFNTATPDLGNTDHDGHGLTKAFKQKEIRQRELSNLLEDVKELNKRTETLSESVL